MADQRHVMLVTGAARGIGAAVARHAAVSGYHVVLNYTASRDAAEALAAEIRESGRRALAVRADVADEADVLAMYALIDEHFGRLDVLVNNAGTTSFIPHHDLDAVTMEIWHNIMGVNLIGPFQMARAAASALKASGAGHIVNVSSVAGVYGTGSSIPYCASKAALNNLTVTLARVMGPEVQVNTVCPGFIDGSWLQEGFGDAFEAIKQSVVDKSLLRAVCTPDDVKDAIFGFLLGSKLTTGEIVVVDGGVGRSAW
jgi:3-oxoacyl-[acyl-carrier protein] reductase